MTKPEWISDIVKEKKLLEKKLEKNQLKFDEIKSLIYRIGNEISSEGVIEDPDRFVIKSDKSCIYFGDGMYNAGFSIINDCEDGFLTCIDHYDDYMAAWEARDKWNMGGVMSSGAIEKSYKINIQNLTEERIYDMFHFLVVIRKKPWVSRYDFNYKKNKDFEGTMSYVLKGLFLFIFLVILIKKITIS